MKLYVDSNAFVSLYANDNPGHAVLTREALAEAIWQASSPITYAEVRAAFKALRHNKRISEREYKQAITDFDRDWPRVETIDVDPVLALYAGSLADALQLKGCDAVHVATATTMQALTGDVQFLTFDSQLEKRIVASGIVPVWKSKED